jgi:hypothetical protein
MIILSNNNQIEFTIKTIYSCHCLNYRDQAYFTLARPLVEYASTVWDLYTQADIKKVEAVQRRAARYVANNHRNKIINGR